MIKKQEKIQFIAICASHTTRAPSSSLTAKSLTAGVQGPLIGPGSSGYFRSSAVISDAFLTPIFPISERFWTIFPIFNKK